MSIVATFGAPVIEALGNSASKTDRSEVLGAVRAVTVEVSCQTVSYFSALNRTGVSTDPTTATLPRSLRTMSTIITFSARSFSDANNASRCSSSSAVSNPRRTVPFIGRQTIRSSRHSKNNSGEADAICHRPVSMYAPYPHACAAIRSR